MKEKCKKNNKKTNKDRKEERGAEATVVGWKLNDFVFIFNHLHSTTTCFESYNSLCFKITDKANSKFDLKIKEALHINWRKPNLKGTTKSSNSHPFAIDSVPPCYFLIFSPHYNANLDNFFFMFSKINRVLSFCIQCNIM